MPIEIVAAEYQPLAGTGFCTIQLAKPKSSFVNMRPGHVLKVYHKDPTDRTLAVEHLAVSSIARGRFSTIIMHHWAKHHAEWPDIEAGQRELFDLYPEASVEQGATFVAIYFQ